MEDTIISEAVEKFDDVANIRFVRPMDPDDMRRMRAICNDIVNRKFVDDLERMNPQDIMDWAIGHQIPREDGWEVLTAAVGKSPFVNEREVDKIQGVVNAYTSELTRKRILFGKRLLPPDVENFELVELVNLRNPHAKPGQMSSADKKTVEMLRIMKGPMIVAAIVEPQNNSGAVTMEVAGFEYVGDAFFPEEHHIMEDGTVSEEADQTVMSKLFIQVMP